MRVQIEITKEMVAALEREAVLSGFTREDPRKAWTDKERKEAVRYAIMNRLPT